MNGLQSLMQGAPRQPQQAQRPQPQQQAQQMDPRMNAAMDVVQNDVPEPLRDLVSKNEFQQKAMQLLQSAGGQAAMGKPTPPTTVAQRVDQQAAEGVAGLMQRLAPGMQQRGKQVQRAQARKMLGGGLPMQAAPNMMRMANGGIVGYQEGGDVKMGPPEPNMLERMGQSLARTGKNVTESDLIMRQAIAKLKAGQTITEAERNAIEQRVAAEEAAKGPNILQRAGEGLMGMGRDTRESNRLLKEAYNNMGKTYEEKAKGMAMGGGVKGYAGPDGSVVEADKEFSYAEMVPTERPESTMPALTNFFDSEREFRRKRAEVARLAKARNISPEEAARVVSQSERPSRRLDEVPDLGGIGSLTSGERTPEFRMKGVGAAGPTATEFMPEGSSAMGGVGSPQSNVDSTIQSILDLRVPEADISTLPRSPLKDPVEDAMLGNIKLDPNAEREAARKAERDLAQAAYAVSPEMQQEYADRKAALDKYYASQLDPKKQRRDELRAMLKGFATPGGIARSGIAAGEGVAAVRDAARAAELKKAEERFGITKELADIERAGGIEAYKAGAQAGQSAYERSSAMLNQAAQSLTQIATSDETRAQAAAVQEYTRQMDGLKSQLDVYLQQQKLDAGDKRTVRQIVNDLRRSQSAVDNRILDIQNSMIVYNDAEKAQARLLIQAAQAQKAEMQADIDSYATKLGLTPRQTPAASTSGAVEAADYFK